MKIIFRLFSLFIISSILWLLLQNFSYIVSVDFFDKHFDNVHLSFIILAALIIGLIIGALLLGLVALQYKSDLSAEKKRSRLLSKELDALRNLSIDEISLDEDNEGNKTLNDTKPEI